MIPDSKRRISTWPAPGCSVLSRLGILVGLVSVLYIRSIYAFEDFFEQHVPGNYYTRHMLGMLAVGVIMYVLYFRGHYHVEGSAMPPCKTC